MSLTEKIIICLPTKNEKESISLMISRIQKLEYELFISDSNSTDGTIKIAKELKVPVFQRDAFGKGYGCGILNAIDVASKKGYQYLLFLDCDTTYPPEQIPLLVNELKANPNLKMIVGTRSMNSISFSHRLVNLFHTNLANLLFDGKISDINSGMRLIKISSFEGNLSEKHMGMVAQISSFTLRNDLEFKEVPINYGTRLGDSKIRFWDTLTILWAIIKERLKDKVKNLN